MAPSRSTSNGIELGAPLRRWHFPTQVFEQLRKFDEVDALIAVDVAFIELLIQVRMLIAAQRTPYGWRRIAFPAHDESPRMARRLLSRRSRPARL
jgi:hypothetical protein